MADKEVIIDIKLDDKDIKETEKAVEKLEQSVMELNDEIKKSKEENKALNAELKKLNKEEKEGKKTTEQAAKEREKLNQKIKENNINISRSTFELSQQKRQLTANRKVLAAANSKYEEASKTLNHLRKKAKDVALQFGLTSKEFKEASRRVTELDTKLKDVDNALGQNQRKVGDYEGALGKLQGAFGKLNMGIAVITGAIAATAAIRDSIDKVNDISRKWNATTDATASQIDDLTEKTLFLSRALDAEYKDVIKSSTILSAEFGISASESLDLIEKGFRKGANVNGEFLQLLKEYPAQLKSVGLNAEESIAILTETERAGVFSDKGVDAIKEAGIRLREMTPATEAAIDAIGLSGQEIQQQLTDGSITTFEAIQMVSAKMGELPENSKVVGTAIADIFGGAGEDAGLRYIKTLSTINTDLNKVEDNTNKLTEAQIRFDEKLAKIEASASSSGGTLNSVYAEVLDLITEIMTIFEEVGAEFSELGESINELFSVFSDGSEDIDFISVAFEQLKDILNASAMPLKILIKLVKGLVDGIRVAVGFVDDATTSFTNFVGITDQVAPSLEKAEKKTGMFSKAFKFVKDGVTQAGDAIDEFNKKSEKIKTPFTKKTTEKQKEFAAETKKINNEIALLDKQIKNIDAVPDIKMPDAKPFMVDVGVYDPTEKIKENMEKGQKGYMEKSQEIKEKRLKANQEEIQAEVEKYATIGNVALESFNLINTLNNNQLQDLEYNKQKELEATGDNAEERERIEKKFAKQKYDLELKQFRTNQIAALGQIAIDTALAVAKVWGQTGLGGIIAQGAPIAMGIFQAANVLAAQPPPPPFALGGTIVDAGSHSSGNDMTIYGQTKSGKTQAFGRVEGGEMMTVVKKNATDAIRLSNINKAYGGRSFASGHTGSFADGGQIDTTMNNTNGLTANDIANAIQNVQIVTRIEDINQSAAKKAEIVDNGQI